MDDKKTTEESTNEETQEEVSEEKSDQSSDEPTEQEEAPEAEEVESEEEPESEPQKAPEEEPKPSRRESLRIQQLIARHREETKPPPLQTPGGLDYGEALDADPEVISQLETDRQSYGQALYNQGLQQVETVKWETRLEADAPKVESKYSQLDKESSDFNPALADAVNTMYLSTAGYNPQDGSVQNTTVRYSEYVDSIFELANEIAGEKVAKTSENIAKQAASTGLRPDGSATKRLNLNQDPGSMSDEELAAVIAQDPAISRLMK